MSLARRSYALSWVLPFLSGCLPSSLCTYYSTLLIVCQEVFYIFSKLFFRKTLRPCYTHNGKHSSAATFSPWHTYYSTVCAICQGVFEKNRNFFSKGCSLFTMGVVATHRVFGLVSQRGWTQICPVPYPLDIFIIAHLVLFVKSFLKLFSKNS